MAVIPQEKAKKYGAVITISTQILAKALGLPDAVCISHVLCQASQANLSTNNVRLVLRSHQKGELPKVDEGMLCPEVLVSVDEGTGMIDLVKTENYVAGGMTGKKVEPKKKRKRLLDVEDK